MKLIGKFFTLAALIISPIPAQAAELPSLRSLALDKAAEALHSDLAKPQSPDQRKIILDHWQDKAGVLFMQPAGSSNLYNQTILERFEQKYATQLKKITKINGLIQAITLDGTKCLSYILNVIADINTGTCLHRLLGHTNFINHVAFTSDKTKAISASSDKTLKVWDINTGTCLHTLQGHNEYVTHVALTSDNTKAISASNDSTLKVWDINTGTCLHTLQGHNEEVTRVALTSDNTKAISASWDKTLKVWDINTGQCLQTIGTDRFIDALIHKNLVVQGDSIYRFEDHQDIIIAMPQPQPGDTIHNPAHLIDLTQTGAVAGLAKLQAVKNKKIAMGQSPKTLKDKLINGTYYLKNKIASAYKRLL